MNYPNNAVSSYEFIVFDYGNGNVEHLPTVIDMGPPLRAIFQAMFPSYEQKIQQMQIAAFQNMNVNPLVSRELFKDPTRER